jgi:hypothetical protein
MVWFMVFNATFNAFLAEVTCELLLSHGVHRHNTLTSRNRHDRMVVGFITTYAISTYHH